MAATCVVDYTPHAVFTAQTTAHLRDCFAKRKDIWGKYACS
jgi:hypothetical protein